MDISGKTLVLVGGAGLIGSHIVDQLISEPVKKIIIYDNFARGTRKNLAEAVKSSKVEIVEASMMDFDHLNRTLEGADGVFLLASLWLGECVNKPRSAWNENVMGSWNVVEACIQQGIKRVVYSSSASVYGNALFTPMTEEHPFNNRTTYGATKIAIEQMFRAIYEQHKLPYIGMRYMNVYGPRMDYEGVYVSVIMKALDKIFAEKPPVIYGDGSQMYDFIYVEDVAEANILGMKSDCVDMNFNIGRGIGTTINELVAMLLELTNSKLEPEYIPQAQSFVTHRIGSIENAKKYLGFTARTPLLEGMRNLVNWRLSTK